MQKTEWQGPRCTVERPTDDMATSIIDGLDISDRAKLAVKWACLELLDNSRKHGRPTRWGQSMRVLPAGGVITSAPDTSEEVTLMVGIFWGVYGRSVRIAVSDPSDTIPDFEKGAGFGLSTLRSLSGGQCGAARNQDKAGKTVWVDIPATSFRNDTTNDRL